MFYWQRFTLVGVLLASLVLIAPAQASIVPTPRLYLHRGTIDARHDSLGRQATLLAAANPGYVIVQFAQPIQATDRDALIATGVTLLEYIPDNAYLITGSVQQLSASAKLTGVYAQIPFLAADKLAPALLAALQQQAAITPLPVLAVAWPGQEARLAQEFVQRGWQPQQAFTAQQLLELIQIPAVRWLEPAPHYTTMNLETRNIIGVQSAWQGHGLFGAGQLLAVTDSGLDTGDLATISPDFRGRIHATQVLSTGGDLADQFGHGTHVLGSAAGAGVQSGANPTQHIYTNSFAGVAPEASLVVQAFETRAGGSVLGMPADPYTLFAWAYAQGARIHTNSWGGPTGFPIPFTALFGGYPLSAQRTDAFIWEHPDMSIFFAAGNSGNDAIYSIFGCIGTGDGVIDPDSINAPGTAKNVITVGASEGLQANAPGSTRTYTESLSPFDQGLLPFTGTCFPNEPIASDTFSDDPRGMAAFSSRGPTDDTRIKPDIVAPGTNILSNRSHVPGSSKLWGDYQPNEHYRFAGGTSMATPIAAGVGVLIREWLNKQNTLNPSAALLKALLLATASNIAPGQYGTDQYKEIPESVPNNVSGWGRVDLGFLQKPAPYTVWYEDHTTGLNTGASTHYQRVQANSSEPLHMLLVWSDPPASLSASKQLVNDLDLRVTAPDGSIVWGNRVAGGDRVNNVEGLAIDTPLPGTYTITIQAHSVPISQQPYALVVAGATSTGVAPTPSPQPTPSPIASWYSLLPFIVR